METFAFDPASNLLDEKNQQVQRPLHHDPKHNNLLREYAGSHYDYDERGNQIRRWHNGQHSRLHWDLFDRLVRFENSQLRVDYAYDPLGRRLYKRKRPINHTWQKSKRPINHTWQKTDVCISFSAR